MKKINIIASIFALFGLMLTSCDNEQVLPPVSFPEGGSLETMGNGNWDNPYRVWQVLLGTDNSDESGTMRESVWVTGYIVGYISTDNGNSVFNAESAKFTAVGAANTNLLLAETPEETNWEKCATVQLPSGNIRNALNLQSNPQNLGKEICLKGSLEKYFGAHGVKSLSGYQWGSEGEEGPEPAPGPGAGGTVTGGTTYLSNGFGDFTIDNISMSGGVTYVWTWDSYNYAKASAYVGGSNQNAEAYLISPEIKLDATAPAATFSQAINYLNGNNRADFLEVCVREGASGTWTPVEVSTWPAGTGWTFSDGCYMDLKAFAGKTVQIAFHYKSTTSCSPTWEVKNLVVGKAAN